MRSLPILLLVACGSSKADSTETDSSKPPGCDLTGLYRVTSASSRVEFDARFRIENRGGVWTGVIVKPRPFEIERDIKISQDGDRCSFTAAMKTRVGPVFVQLSLDAKTDAAKGTVRLADARDDSVPLIATRADPTKSPRSCIHPGTYKLVVPHEQEGWITQEKYQNCDKAQIEMPLFVDVVGDKLVIEHLDKDGDIDGETTVTPTDDCNARIDLHSHQGISIATRVTFNGDQIAAAPMAASVRIEEGGGHWLCQVLHPMAWITK